MASPYTSQTITGYNSSPPSDDGSATEANEITWAKHKTKLADPVKTLAEAINTENVSAFGEILFNATSYQTTNYDVLASDRGKLITCANEITITLLAAATATSGFPLCIQNIGTNLITVDGDGSEVINGNTTVGLSPGESLLITSNGANWYGPKISQAFTKGPNAASANDLSFWPGEVFDITGTTTINGVVTRSAGNISVIQFDQALILKHNTAPSAGFEKLSLPGSADITTEAGDIAILISDGDGANYRVLYYKVDGKPIIPPAFYENYTSTEQTITSAGPLTLEHGLSAEPTLIQFHLVCQSDEEGWVTGDKITMELGTYDGSAKTQAVWFDSTNIYVRFEDATAASFGYTNKGSGVVVTLTNDKWKLVMRAWV